MSRSPRFFASVCALALGMSPLGWVSAAPPVPGKAASAKAPAGKTKAKKGAAGSKNSALSAALSDKGTAIQKCAIDHAMEQGASSCTVDVRVTINRMGNVVDRQIEISADKGDTAAVKTCVEDLVNSAKFPQVNTPLATAQQSWKVVAQ